MKKFLSKYWKACLSLAFGVAVFLFWRYGYYYALSYQEQFQLFLFDSGYFMERLAQPGGLARYLGEFVVQFYNSSTDCHSICGFATLDLFKFSTKNEE